MGTLQWMDELIGTSQAGRASAPERGVWPEPAFEFLFRQHYTRLVHLVARLLGERALAEEVAGDAFWKLFHRPALAAEGNNVPGWLYRTATRLALDRLRARTREQRFHHQLEGEATVGRPPATPLSALERGEQAARVRRALARLKPLQAQLLLLRHEGWSYRDIAAAMGIKSTSVGTTLARAERAFAAQWRSLDEDSQPLPSRVVPLEEG